MARTAAAAAGDPTEHGLERLRRCAAALPPEEQPPELAALLSSLEGLQKAEDWLSRAAEGLGPPPAVVEGPAFEARQEASQASTALMMGLLHLLEASAAGFVVGIHSMSPRLQTLLSTSVLYPALFKVGRNRKAGRPRHGSARIAPVEALKQLATAMALFIFQREYNDWMEVSPLAFASAALEAFWPDCGLSAMSESDQAPEARRARALLSRRDWVPSLVDQEGSSAGAGSGGAAACVAQQQGRQLKVAPLSICADNLKDILAHLASRDADEELGVVPSLSDVRRWALLLWIELANDRHRQGAHDAPPARHLLTAVQLGLSSGLLSDVERAKLALVGASTAAGVHTSVDAGTPRSRSIIQLMEDARQLAVAARAWLIAGEVARNQCGQLAIEAGAATGSERAAAVRRVEETLQYAEACLASAKPWAPGMLYKHVLARTKEAKADWELCRRNLASHPDTPFVGLCTTVMGAAPTFTKPTCDHCGEAALHLRACSACKSVRYCSKACQVAAWKTGGHKTECATLATARASRQARGVTA